jgi:hypothetical protein
MRSYVECMRCGAGHWGWLHLGWRLDPHDPREDACPVCRIR